MRIAVLLFVLTALCLPAASFSADINHEIVSIARDKHGRIARSSAAKNAFKREHPCPATGKPKGACPGYVIDHIIALKRGGPDSPANMQWQTIKDAKAKDRWE
jgi:hypothetical protein